MKDRQINKDIIAGTIDNMTFLNLVWKNRNFRYYLLSVTVNHIGEWLTYIASISVIERILAENGSTMSRTALGIWVVIRLIPCVVLTLISGTLADYRDRRETMIYLNFAGAVVSLLFIVSFSMKSVSGIYAATFLQESVAALIAPCSSSILPSLVTQEEHLQKAITLSGLSLSVMGAFGSTLGGFCVATIGVNACYGKFQQFSHDSFSRLISRITMLQFWTA
jgi:MFS family permease